MPLQGTFESILYCVIKTALLPLDLFVRCHLINYRNATLALQTNQKKWTPLMYACSYCQENIVRLLVSHIPSCVYSMDAHSQTPLMVAAKSGNLNIVKMVAQVFTQ